MNRKKVKEIYHYLLENGFEGLKNIKIVIMPAISNKFFMGTIKILGIWFLFVEKDALKLREAAFIGCMAHELCHILCPKFNERAIDIMVIEKGYGQHLYEFIKYHDKNYEKYNKSDGLTKNEIKKLIKKQ